MGGASVILILLVLALSVFALLALRSSYNERKLARRTAESVQDYYKMDARAEKLFARIDALLGDAYSDRDAPVEADVVSDALFEISGVTDVLVEDGLVTGVSYEIGHERQENISLQVELVMNFGAGESEGTDNFVQIRKWKMVTAESGEYELEITD